MMKFSIYNSIIPLTKNSKLIYNALSDQYVVFKSTMELNNIEKQFDTELYRELIKRKHLVDDRIDEITLLKDKIRQINSEDGYYDLIINPTLDCNFHCWYCYEKHIKGSKMDVLTLNKVKILIDNIIKEKKHLEYFHLSFFGGEPLMYFEKTVKPIIEHFSQVCQRKDVSYDISFTSNGYLFTEDMLPIFKQNKINFFQITLDGCEEEHNKVRFISRGKGSYDVILKNIKILLKEKMAVTLRINYTAKNINGVRSILNDLTDIDPEQKLYLSIDFQRVWQDGDLEYSIEDILVETMEIFKKGGFDVSRRRASTVERPCYADRECQVLINYNGDVFKCTARDFRPERREGFLNENGEIIWENDALEKRLNVKLKNEHCLSCRVAPLCCGGCSQQGLERKKDYCLLEFDEQKKDQMIIDRLAESILNNQIVV